MERREQEILEKIGKQTENIKVPETLEPERIEALLKEKGGEQKKNKKRTIYHIGGLAAACIVLAAGLGVLALNGRTLSGEGVHDAVTQEEEKSKGENSKQTEEPDSYEEVFEYVKKARKSTFRDGGFSLFGRSGGAVDMEVKESEAVDTAVNTAENAVEDMAGGGSYSETNVRQEGVDEADVVKTDGRYLYALKENGTQIVIVDTKGSLTETGCIEVGEKSYIQEFYLLPKEKKLVYIQSSYEKNSVHAVTMDIRDPKNPKEMGMVKQSGYYQSSRMTEGHLYLFTNYSVGSNFSKYEPKTFIPLVNDELIEEKDIILPPFDYADTYEVITTVDIKQPSKTKDSKAMLTSGGELYVSNGNIYYYETQWGDGKKTETTTIRRMGYKDGKLLGTVKGKIEGYINDSFSIDEYAGHLRIVATVGETNSVYVLDGRLKMVGTIEGLAKDERVYSARFMGDVGYFVTFRETDPLFSVDLSDPKNPRIVGKLKIPGFSEYLHFYGKDKLLGIGMNVEEGGQTTDGVKISMFDISDKTDVKEENKLVLKNVYSTNVSYDYKAVLADADKNMIGFAGYTEGGQKYYLFSYDEKEGFQCDMEEEINGNSGMAARGVYIDETIYIVCGNVIEAYSLKDYKKVDDIIL